MKRPFDYIFKPRSVAIIGASRQPFSIGQRIVQNILESGFRGDVFLVNPHADMIGSLRCYPNLEAVPGDVELAVIVVPQQAVLSVIDECIAKPVGAVVVISGGFGEAGRAGAKLEQELVHRVRAGGLRLVGPNSMGIMNAVSDVRLNASLGPLPAWADRIALVCQSGALGFVMLNMIQRLGLGLSMFASLGNMSDLSTDDLLEYWADEQHTNVILMYVDSFGDVRRFTQLARRVSRRKPIVALKTSGSLPSALTSDPTRPTRSELMISTDSLFQQCGLLRAGSAEELLDFALAFSHCAAAQGSRVAVISNDRGLTTLVVDACVHLGLSIARLSAKTITALKAALPDDITVSNPVNLTANASAETYRLALDTVLADGRVDAALVLLVPAAALTSQATVDAVVPLLRQYDKPVLCVVTTTEESLRALRERARGLLPIYPLPESAARALGALIDYHRLQQRPEGERRRFDVDVSLPQAILKRARDEGRLALNLAEALRLIDAYGIPTCAFNFAATLDEAIAHAHEIGYPVVLKLIAQQLLHKSDVGGVILDIRNDDELTRSYASLMERAERHGIAEQVEGVMIQQMVRGGREVIIGMVHDATFGPLITFGLNSADNETPRDISARVWPLTDLDATELIKSLRGYPMLQGTKDHDPIDFVLVEEALLRVSQLVEDFPAIAELSINPFIAGYKPDTSKAVDVKITLFSEPSIETS